MKRKDRGMIGVRKYHTLGAVIKDTVLTMDKSLPERDKWERIQETAE